MLIQVNCQEMVMLVALCHESGDSFGFYSNAFTDKKRSIMAYDKNPKCACYDDNSYETEEVLL